MTPTFLTFHGESETIRGFAQRSVQYRAVRAGLAILAATFGAGASRAGDMATHRYASLMEARRRARR
jgi:hypothetical protein